MVDREQRVQPPQLHHLAVLNNFDKARVHAATERGDR